MRHPNDNDVIEEAACIAHDLLNPLSAIQVVVSALRLNDVDRTVAQALGLIERNLVYMDRLIHEIVDVSRVEHEVLRLRRESVDFRVLLTHMQQRMAFDSSRVSIELSADTPVNVIADPVRIERVLVNLIENALKYSSSLVLVRLERRDDRVRVTIRDRGPGITCEEVDTLFRIHRRLRAALSRDGAGLGLYISRKIVEAHGGVIGVESSPGEGSCFYFELPMQAPILPASAVTGGPCP